MKKWPYVILIISGGGILLFGVFILFIVFPIDIFFLKIELPLDQKILTAIMILSGLAVSVFGIIRLRRCRAA